MSVAEQLSCQVLWVENGEEDEDRQSRVPIRECLLASIASGGLL